MAKLPCDTDSALAEETKTSMLESVTEEETALFQRYEEASADIYHGEFLTAVANDPRRENPSKEKMALDQVRMVHRNFGHMRRENMPRLLQNKNIKGVGMEFLM